MVQGAPLDWDATQRKWKFFELKDLNVKSLSTIKSKSVRNILRGILAAENPSVCRRAMIRLRTEANNSDLEAAYLFFITNPTARHVPLAPMFPAKIEDSTSAPYLGDNRFEAELAVQNARFTASEPELLRAIQSIKQINESILSRDGSRLTGLIQAHTNDFGMSLFLLRKTLSIRHTKFGQDKNLNMAAAIEPFFSRRRHLIAVAFEDSIDEQLSYIRVRRTFLSHVEKGRVSRAVRPLLLDLMSPASRLNDSSLFPLEAYSRWGVLDCLAFLERNITEQDQIPRGNLPEKILNVIPTKVHRAWTDAFSSLEIEDVVELLGGEQSFREYRLFRHAPAWSEVQAISQYRNQIEIGFGYRLDGTFHKKEVGPSIVGKTVSEAIEFLPEGEIAKFPKLPIDPKTSGVFLRSLALAGTPKKNSSQLNISDGQELLQLLDKTMDVSLLLSNDELSTLLPTRTNDRLYEYLRTALQYDAEAGRVTDHAFRRATQDLVGREFGGNIVDFAKYLNADAPSVAEHFFATCNEYFLTELYLLFEDSDAVIDAQANMLEWYGETRDNEDAVTRAKSHRLNLRLRKVRGSIDDTRIYVDQLRFQYWATDEIAAQLRELAIAGDALLDSENSYPNLNDPIAAVESQRTKLFQLLDLAFKEFCTNEFYGVDSYIGRRIRHGTLHGVLVAELRELVDKIVEEFRYSAPNFSRFVEGWHKNVDVVVRTFGAELLQVRSNERKLGLIVPSVGDGDKRSTALNMLNSVASALAKDRSIGNAISFIYDFCWLLLEIDLKRLRAAALSAQQELVIRPNQHISGTGSDIEGQILDASRHLNTELQQRFEYLSGWLTRPSNVSPSATLSLLYNAVILEVQGRYQGFYPKSVEDGETAIDMFGHRFHTFYDVLFVLVDNAAKHGNREGELRFEVRSTVISEMSSEIRMTVSSEMKHGSVKECTEAIIRAMNSDIGSAMLEDRNSGIRKIRVLVGEVEELSDFEVSFSGLTVSFSVVMRLAMTGADHQSEGVV